MGEQKNTIALNGKIYDARSGTLLQTSHQPAKPAPKIMPTASRRRSIDGFVKSAKKPPHATHIPAPRSVASHPATTATHKDPVHTAHKVHQTPQRSKTLMRSSVKKPAPLPHPALLNPTAYYAAQAKSSNPRLIRALAVPKSTAVSRFNPAAASTVVKRTTSLAVKPQPEPVNHAATPAPSLEARIENTVDNLFAQALGQATSHEQPQPVKMKLRHRAATRLGLSAKTLGMSASVLAVLLLGGFFALQNVPNVSMRIASARAGVHGTLPGYTPSGFALAGPIKYGNGSITVSFHSNSDSRAFQVTEQTSEWNSDALLDSYVGVNNRPYQTFSANGRTVYIYNDSDASWVDGGVWYKIEGNSSLSSDQLLHIAESI